MREPTLRERVHGSPELRRRQATGRRPATGLARIEVVDADAAPATGSVVGRIGGEERVGSGGVVLSGGSVVIPVACLGTYEMARRRGVRRPLARLVLGRPIRVGRHPDDLPLNRRLVAATTENIRSALAALVSGAHEARSGEPEGMVA